LRRPVASCADVARTRGEAISASAAPYRRHFVVEMPGSWGCSPLDERQLAPVPRDNTRARPKTPAWTSCGSAAGSARTLL